MHTIEELTELENQVGEGLKKAYKKMVVFKKQKNTPLVVARNGKIVEIAPDNMKPTTSAKK